MLVCGQAPFSNEFTSSELRDNSELALLVIRLTRAKYPLPKYASRDAMQI